MDTASVGIEIALAVVIGLLFGGYVDSVFDSSPWATLFFTAAGLGAAIKAVIRTWRQYTVRQDSDALEPGGGRPLGTASYDRWSR